MRWSEGLDALWSGNWFWEVDDTGMMGGWAGLGSGWVGGLVVARVHDSREINKPGRRPAARYPCYCFDATSARSPRSVSESENIRVGLGQVGVDIPRGLVPSWPLFCDLGLVYCGLLRPLARPCAPLI